MRIKKIEGTWFLINNDGELIDSFDDKESRSMFDRGA